MLGLGEKAEEVLAKRPWIRRVRAREWLGHRKSKKPIESSGSNCARGRALQHSKQGSRKSENFSQERWADNCSIQLALWLAKYLLLTEETGRRDITPLPGQAPIHSFQLLGLLGNTWKENLSVSKDSKIPADAFIQRCPEETSPNVRINKRRRKISRGRGRQAGGSGQKQEEKKKSHTGSKK